MATRTAAAAPIGVVAFDVFGTVVDWHGTIAREMARVAPHVDGDAFANAWREGYQPAMARVRSGELGWTKIDTLHRTILDAIVPRFGLQAMPERERRDLNLVWHRLDPWPEVPAALARLKTRFMLCTLSNGNLGLLANMARHAALPWDLILSAEVFRHYKPDPETYLGVAEVFDVAPASVLMVAAHKSDLRAARGCGLATAFVTRPLEYGPNTENDLTPDPSFDFHATGFDDLATQLGC